MNNSDVLKIIRYYCYTIPETKRSSNKYQFNQCSFSKWATDELYLYIKKRPETPALISIEEFIKKMDEYACLNINVSYIFSIAHDIAEDILDIFILDYRN